MKKIKYTWNPLRNEEYKFRLDNGASYLFRKANSYSQLFLVIYYPYYNAKYTEAEVISNIDHIVFRYPELANLLIKNIDMIQYITGCIAIPQEEFYKNILSKAEEHEGLL